MTNQISKIQPANTIRACVVYKKKIWGVVLFRWVLVSYQNFISLSFSQDYPDNLVFLLKWLVRPREFKNCWLQRRGPPRKLLRPRKVRPVQCQCTTPHLRPTCYGRFWNSTLYLCLDLNSMVLQINGLKSKEYYLKYFLHARISMGFWLFSEIWGIFTMSLVLGIHP